ncbi:hypothetical protein Q1695_006681 [Nippostrongylus brasiliensis]|nr:hypothetical protein Q1695_006669 [Nippostrongylus brasiliensis]WKY06689.1 hypothetical protein Q1695_006681 [Nippostrongylus brasiliensis]
MTVIGGRLLVLFSICTLSSTANLHCDNNLFCSKTPHRGWLARRRAALRLLDFHKLTQGEGYISINSTFFATYEQKENLCGDELYTGFLLEKDAPQWNVSCLWTGTSLGVTCAPVPPEYDNLPFAFLPPYEWQKRIKDFRIKIGCSREKINQTGEIAELFICNERCIQGGIGYIPSLIMLLSFSIAFIKNCLM